MMCKGCAGVGISRQEGMQAVMSSDFAIAQFRFLEPLLPQHIERICMSILRCAGLCISGQEGILLSALEKTNDCN